MLILGLQKTTLLDYPGKIASTIFTGGCNFRCPYCHNKDLVISPTSFPSLSEEEIFEHLNKKRKVLDGVCITGGEATIQPDLYTFISKVKSLDLLVKLDTNGTNPTILKELINNHLVDYVAMDIKHSKENYNVVAKCSSLNMDNIQESIDILMASDISYEFRTTLVKELHSEADILRIGEWIKGAKAYYLQSYKESEQVIDPIFSPFTNDEIFHFVDLLKPFIPNTSARGID